MKDKIIIKCIKEFSFNCCGKRYKVNKGEVVKPCVIKADNDNEIKIGIKIDDIVCCIGGRINGTVELDRHFISVILS